MPAITAIAALSLAIASDYASEGPEKGAPIEALPEWWPGEPVYHGTRARRLIEKDGLSLGPAYAAVGDPEYGWEGVWAGEVTSIILHDLNKEELRSLCKSLGKDEDWILDLKKAFKSWEEDEGDDEDEDDWGESIPELPCVMSDLGDLVSLFWVTKLPKTARSASGGLSPGMAEVDLSKLNYLFWFPDEILGERSYVFVLPRETPQAPSSAFSWLTHAPAESGRPNG